MLTEPLPTALDVRKAAVREAGIRGVLNPAELQRFRSLLAGDDGAIQVAMRFSRDEEDRYVIHLDIEADVVVTCQRCLESMPEHLSCENTLAVVWSDRQAAALPRHLDPLILAEQSCNPRDVVEDELILALRPFSYHDNDACRERLAAYSDGPAAEGAGEQKSNPFDVLASLKRDTDHQE